MTLPSVRPDPPEPNQHGFTPSYVSPHGHLSGLRDRLKRTLARLGTDRSLPWVGLGLVKDLEVILQLLNLQEFAEWLRVNGPPEHRGFADDILADQFTLEAVRDENGPLEAPEIETFDATAVNSARIRQPLYAARKKIFPKRAEGRFRRFKWIVMLITLGIYYLTPWLRWDRGPYAPNQAVLIDLAHRRFYMFNIEIWPHEFYFVAGLLIMAGIGLFVITSAVGRAWSSSRGLRRGLGFRLGRTGG